ncbi:protein kinase [Nonomuraea sp. NPDC005650]|uniref:WD40 repeat domain-containing serine/threonine protein kinase n=1 Tax=Nonomuraea sp. NPDC005650 TaxID=3157045 RepID=UPI0033AF373A
MRWQPDEVIDGRYQVVRQLGEGGMGVVYQVRHLEWQVDLAVKRPNERMFRTQDDKREFVAEAETWVNLGLHPHLCGCHYIRDIDGVPAIFVEYLSEGNVCDRITDGTLYGGEQALARMVDLSIQIAWGLEYAHGRGLVHRDVKPSNVLLGTRWTAKVTDFGLAQVKGGGAAADRPDSGVLVPNSGLMMSPPYASPEQIRGEPLGHHTDVFSFAVSVLEMFTGRLDWGSGLVAADRLRRCFSEGSIEAGPPRMPADVFGLLDRCLRTDPDERPATMAEIATELKEIYGRIAGRPYVRQEPVTADLRAGELNNRALSFLDLGRTVQADTALDEALSADPQHPIVTYNAGLLRWRRGELTDEEVIAQLESAGGGSPLAKRLLAHVHLERGDTTTATELAEGFHGSEPDLAAAMRLVRTGHIIDASCGHVGPAFSNAWPSGGHALALSADATCFLIGQDNGDICVKDPNGRERTLGGHRAKVTVTDVTPDGRFGASSSLDGTVRIWDLRRGGCLRAFRVDPVHEDGYSFLVRISADGRSVIWEDGDHRAQVWDIPSGRRLSTLGAPSQYRMSVALNAAGSLALTSSIGGIVELWNVGDGSRLRQLVGPIGSGILLQFSPDERHAVVGGGLQALGREIWRWDLRTGRHQVLRGHSATVHSFAMSGDGRFLVSGADDGTLLVWDVTNQRCLRTFREHQGAVVKVFVDVLGRAALSWGSDSTMRGWSLPSDYRASWQLSTVRDQVELRRSKSGFVALVAEAEQAMEEERYRTAHDLLVRARDVPGYEREARLVAAWRRLGRHAIRIGLRAAGPAIPMPVPPPRRKPLSSRHPYTVSPDGRIALCGDGTDLQYVELDTGTAIELSPESRYRHMNRAVLSPNGRQVLISTIDSRHDPDNENLARESVFMLWQPQAQNQLRILERRSPTAMAFGPDGRHALTGYQDGSLAWWDLGKPSRVWMIDAHPAEISDVWIGQDGRTAVSCGWDPSVRIWDLRSGALTHRLEHPERVLSVCLSADGRTLLTCSIGDQSAVRVWDMGTGSCRRAFGEPSARATMARMDAEGHYAVTTCVDSAVRLWDIHTGTCLRTLEAHTQIHGATLSPDGAFIISWDSATMSSRSILRWELEWDLAVHDPAG